MSKPKSPASVDAATAQLMRDLEQGLQEAHDGVYARISTPHRHCQARRWQAPSGNAQTAGNPADGSASA